MHHPRQRTGCFSRPIRIRCTFAEGGIGDLRLDEYFKELPLGDGDVPFDKYLDALEDIGYSGFLTVERECGADPYADIKRAVDYLKSNINA